MPFPAVAAVAASTRHRWAPCSRTISPPPPAPTAGRRRLSLLPPTAASAPASAFAPAASYLVELSVRRRLVRTRMENDGRSCGEPVFSGPPPPNGTRERGSGAPPPEPFPLQPFGRALLEEPVEKPLKEPCQREP
jgi:hypothetical protein